MFGTTFIVGNIGFGALARTFERWGVSVSRFSGVTMVLFVLVQGLIAAVPLPPMAVWAAYSVLGSPGILTYAVLAEHFPARLIGRVNTSFTLVILGDLCTASGDRRGAGSLAGARRPLSGPRTSMGLVRVGRGARACRNRILHAGAAMRGREVGLRQETTGSAENAPRRDPVENGLKLKRGRQWVVEPMDFEARSVSSYNLKV